MPSRKEPCVVCGALIEQTLRNIDRHVRKHVREHERKLKKEAQLAQIRKISNDIKYMSTEEKKKYTTDIYKMKNPVGRDGTLNTRNLSVKELLIIQSRHVFGSVLTSERFTKEDGLEAVPFNPYVWKEWMPSVDEYKNFKYWHAVCRFEDINVIKRYFDVMRFTCMCFCNRIKFFLNDIENGTLNVNDVVDMFFNEKECLHYHFIIKTSLAFDRSSLFSYMITVNDYLKYPLEFKLMQNLAGHCQTPLDLFRLICYIQRRTGSYKIRSHFGQAVSPILDRKSVV